MHCVCSDLRSEFELTFIVFTEPINSANMSRRAVVTGLTVQGNSLIPSHQWKLDGYGAAYQYLCVRPEIAVLVGEVSMVTTVQFWQMVMKNVLTPMPTIWLMVILKNTKWS